MCMHTYIYLQICVCGFTLSSAVSAHLSCNVYWYLREQRHIQSNSSKLPDPISVHPLVSTKVAPEIFVLWYKTECFLFESMHDWVLRLMPGLAIFCRRRKTQNGTLREGSCFAMQFVLCFVVRKFPTKGYGYSDEFRTIYRLYLSQRKQHCKLGNREFECVLNERKCFGGGPVPFVF